MEHNALAIAGLLSLFGVYLSVDLKVFLCNIGVSSRYARWASLVLAVVCGGIFIAWVSTI